MQLDHPTLLFASVLVTSVLSVGHLFFGFMTKGNKSSLDMAIGTFLYTLLCLYYLREPGMPEMFRLVSIFLISLKLFFLYRAIRRELGLLPNDRIDVGVLFLSLLIGAVVSMFSGFFIQQLLYTAFILHYAAKAVILAMKNRQTISPRIFIIMMFFIFSYSGLFVGRTVRFLIFPPTTEIYSTENSSLVTTVVLLIIYTIAYGGIHFASMIRAEVKIEELLEDARDEKKFATILVKTIGHDLRSYLAGILGAAEIVQDHSDQVLPLIKANANKALSLLTDLMYWGRSRTGSLGFIEDVVSASSLITGAVDDVQRAADDRGVSIVSRETQDLVRADPTAARVVLRNLLTNALNFSRSGGSVRIRSRRKADNVFISISDDGPGLDDGLLTAVKSGQCVRSCEGNSGRKGTGTGLTIVTSVCEAAGWKLDIESALGAGTTMTVCLSLVESA